jgi:hypothetical protein
MTVLKLVTEADRSYEVALFFLRWGKDHILLQNLFPDLSEIEIRCGTDIANRITQANRHLDEVANAHRKKKHR